VLLADGRGRIETPKSDTFFPLIPCSCVVVLPHGAVHPRRSSPPIRYLLGVRPRSSSAVAFSKWSCWRSKVLLFVYRSRPPVEVPYLRTLLKSMLAILILPSLPHHKLGSWTWCGRSHVPPLLRCPLPPQIYFTLPAGNQRSL